MAGTQNISSCYQLKVHEKQFYDLQLSVNQCELDLNPRPQKSQNGERVAVTTSSQHHKCYKQLLPLGSGYGLFGRVVAFDNRGLQFENFTWNICLQ